MAGPLPVSSLYGMRTHPVTGVRKLHDGIDLMLPTGTPIHAALTGRISRVRSDHPVAGNTITLVSPAGWSIYYAHLSEVDVEPGEQVRRGQLLGLTGATGRVTGPHLHLAVYSPGGGPVDPVSVFPPGTFILA